MEQLESETSSLRILDSYCRHLSPDGDLKSYETSSRYGKGPLNRKSYLKKGYRYRDELSHDKSIMNMIWNH